MPLCSRTDARDRLQPLALACLVVSLLLAATAHGQNASCTRAIGRVVSLQGNVEILRAAEATWAPVKRLDTLLCAGDQVRAGLLSRAGIYIHPETVVRLDQNSTLRFIEQTPEQTLVEFRQEDFTRISEKRAAGQCGVGYFITRFPRRLKVRTPFYNAVVEGTEFQVAMSCDRGELSVFEGQVAAEKLDAPGERVLLQGGQSTQVGTGEAPGAIKALVRPADAVQWALYYLPLSDAGELTEEVLERNCAAASPAQRSGCELGKAEYLLRVGRAEEAGRQLSRLGLAEPNNGDVLALQAIIAVVQNDKARALTLAQRATQAAPKSMRAWAALSYAWQAHFKLEQALEAAQRAAQLAPDSALAKARSAELQLSLGKVRAAERDAREAVRLNANEPRAHLILGFVHLAQIDTKAAKADFTKAIERDSTEPLARLGLGLAIIREGHLTEGREHIEIAVALDPTNSLIRSYVGKAYYEENSAKRDKLAATQFGLAKALDPNDPTPWFYDAILKQTQNRPVEALEDLQKSIALNDNRAVFRSRLALDDDSAARSATMAIAYRDLGLEKLAVVESTKALSENYGSPAAHRLLAEAYADFPRHDIARVSEALQAQIRQPLSHAWIEPLVSTDSLLILRDIGPTLSGAGDYNTLFNRNGPLFALEGVGGSRDTYGDQAIVSVLSDRVSIAAHQLLFRTEGFTDNNAARRELAGGLIQFQASPYTTLQADVRHSRFEIGETFFSFSDFPLPTTILEDSDSMRVSGHTTADSLSDVIWTAAHEDRSRSVKSFPDGALFTNSDAALDQVEGQYLYSWRSISALMGAGYVSEDEQFILEAMRVRTETTNLYLYAKTPLFSDSIRLNAGFSAEWFQLSHSFFPQGLRRSRVSPKLGLIWSLTPKTTIRLASFSAIRRPFLRSQTLEPTQVAGFNQFFTGFERFYGDPKGTVSRRTGAAIDHEIGSSTFMGLSVSSRNLSVPSLILQRDIEWKEDAANLYLYQLLPNDFFPAALKAVTGTAFLEAEYERIKRPQLLTGAEGIMDLKFVRVPIGLQLFYGPNSLRLSTTYVRQDGLFSLDVGFPQVRKEDSGWVTDLLVERQLPGRRGSVAIGVRNIFDKRIDLLEIDPLNPRIATGRIAVARLKLVF